MLCAPSLTLFLVLLTIPLVLSDSSPPTHVPLTPISIRAPASPNPLLPHIPPGLHPADGVPPPGLSALEQARSEANTTAAQGVDAGPAAVPPGEKAPADLDSAPRPPSGHALPELQGGGHGSPADAQNAPLPHVRCADGVCVELGAELLATIEGEQCRSLFVNGKCPVTCGQGLATVLGNGSWPDCARACGNDVVSGAAERWRDMCDRRQESLIDQGKEVVKGFVGEGLRTRLEWRGVFQFLLGVTILVVGVGYGYRKGAGAAQIAYRLQKRRLLGRKNSDQDLPI